jgi:hypothetical protein
MPSRNSASTPLKISLTSTNLFSAVPAGTCLPASRTRHWDVVARRLATPPGVPGYFHSPLTRLGARPSKLPLRPFPREFLVHATTPQKSGLVGADTCLFVDTIVCYGKNQVEGRQTWNSTVPQRRLEWFLNRCTQLLSAEFEPDAYPD